MRNAQKKRVVDVVTQIDHGRARAGRTREADKSIVKHRFARGRAQIAFFEYSVSKRVDKKVY
jgi:hypothetical protein